MCFVGCLNVGTVRILMLKYSCKPEMFEFGCGGVNLFLQIWIVQKMDTFSRWEVLFCDTS